MSTKLSKKRAFFNKINLTKDDDLYIRIDVHKASYHVALYLNGAHAINYITPADNAKPRIHQSGVKHPNAATARHTNSNRYANKNRHDLSNRHANSNRHDLSNRHANSNRHDLSNRQRNHPVLNI